MDKFRVVKIAAGNGPGGKQFCRNDPFGFKKGIPLMRENKLCLPKPQNIAAHGLIRAQRRKRRMAAGSHPSGQESRAGAALATKRCAAAASPLMLLGKWEKEAFEDFPRRKAGNI